MTSKRQVAANRRNASKATGPRTPEGKARSSLNALSHGILSHAPIVAIVETPEQWEAHREAIVSALQPANHLEALLVERIALQAWRLARVARYESERLSGHQEKINDDVAQERLMSAGYMLQAGSDLPEYMGDSPDDLEAFAEMDRAAWEGVDAFVHAIADGDLELATVAHDTAFWTAIAAARLVGSALELDSMVLGDGRRVGEVTAREEWTGPIAWEVLGLLARESEPPEEDPIHLLTKAHTKARETLEAVEQERDKARAEVARRRADSMIPAAHIAQQIVRYESHLERSLYRTLHELQRLQAARSGGTFPLPVAVDVDVTGVAGGR